MCRPRREDAEQITQLGADALEFRFDWSGGCAAFDQRELRGAGFGGFLGEDLAGAGDGVALVVQEALDAERQLHVALAVEALAGAALVGPHLGEFGFPEAEDVGFDAAQLSDFSDAEIELVGDQGFA